MTSKLNAIDTAALLPYSSLIDALADAARQLSSGAIACPERQAIPMQQGAVMLSMAASAPDIAVHKLVSVAPANRARGLPTIIGHLSVIDAASGECAVLLDGATVTARRTAALSMLGIQRFFPAPPRSIVMIGIGKQAESHAHAIREIFPEARLSVIGKSLEDAQHFCERVSGNDWRCIALESIAGDTDVVITATTSRTPVYTLPAMAGRLIVALGAFKPDCAEIAPATVLASTVIVDDLAGARHEAGDLILAGADWSKVRALGDALDAPGIQGPIMFKTVGCAAWDLAAARVALATLRARSA